MTGQRRVFSFLVFAAAVSGLACNYAPLPEELTVELAPGVARVASAHSGPSALADTTWIVYVRTPSASSDETGGEQSDPMPTADSPWLARVRFGHQGQVVSITANADEIPELAGQELIPDGVVRTTIVPGTTYVANSYGAQEDSSIGITALGHLFMGPLPAATASMYFQGQLDGDVIRGVAGWTVQVGPEAQAAFGFRSSSDEMRVVALRDFGSQPGSALPSD